MCYTVIMSGTKAVKSHKAYVRPEEPTNFVINALAALLSFVGVVFLLLKTYGRGALVNTAVSVFGVLFVAVFTVSALCHVFPESSTVRRISMRLDRTSLAVLSCGAFAPLFLIALCRGTSVDSVWGYTLFGISCAATVASILINAFEIPERKLSSLILYVIAAWAYAIRIDRIFLLCGRDCFWMMFGGFAMFTAALAACVFESLPARHTVMHLLIAGGAALQFVSVYTFLL